jgi:hypothetical protein
MPPPCRSPSRLVSSFSAQHRLQCKGGFPTPTVSLHLRTAEPLRRSFHFPNCVFGLIYHAFAIITLSAEWDFMSGVVETSFVFCLPVSFYNAPPVIYLIRIRFTVSPEIMLCPQMPRPETLLEMRSFQLAS